MVFSTATQPVRRHKINVKIKARKIHLISMSNRALLVTREMPGILCPKKFQLKFLHSHVYSHSLSHFCDISLSHIDSC